MLRVRLKADGRLVEILPDGSERAISFSEEPPPARRDNSERFEDAVYARNVRGRTGLTQAAFAAQIGVPVETVRNWEQGKRSPRGPARGRLRGAWRKVSHGALTQPRQIVSADIQNVPSVEANGARIPLLGLGTWDLRGRVCARVVEQALRLGYRHVDTAEMYDNEREVGEGLRASGVKRNDVFLTTKIWPSHFAPLELERTARECLGRLRLGEVDLLLLHWPNPQIPLAETLGALCKVKRDGLARHIGVSNFTVPLMDEALRLSSEPLVCNQFECHPFLDQSKLIAACRQHGIAVVAYSPIAKGRVRDDETLSRIGAEHKKTAAQVCLRFLVQQNIVVIPRTSKVERLSENAAIFDFALSEPEMASIAALARRDGRLVNSAFSAQQNWD
jgi:diketogulonate reductase-like aldo/keto reductase